MEPTELGVVLDSSILIDAERLGLAVLPFLERLAELLPPDNLALSSISVAELAFGIHRANTLERRRRRREFLNDLKASVPVFGITADVAEVAGRINAESSAKGVVIPFDDLLIGACALHHGYSIATRNPRHFKLIPGLTVLSA